MRARTLELLLAGVVGCTSHTQAPSPRDAQARQALLLTTHETAPGRHCQLVDPEAPLPNVATVIDTAAIPEYLHQAGMTGDTGYAVLSIRYDSAGHPARERMIEYSVPDSLAESLRSVIASALLPRPAGSPLAARLRIELGPAPSYRIGKSEYCLPERIVENNAPNPVGLPVTMGATARRSVTEYKYDVEVSPSGEVEDVRFLTYIDVQLAEDFRVELKKQHWRPALDDGLPVTGHATTSLFLETRTRAIPLR